MATGRIGVTPTLGTRWSKAPAGGTTSLSGLDDNSVSLVYSVGYEQVYRNGVLLSRGNDYTATTGNSITLIDATIAGDIIEVFANELVPLTDAISKGQFTAKGALLSATAASTPAVLTVGSNDQVLTADSSTSTGLKWAAVPTGGMTLINTGGTALSGASTTVSSIPTTYNNLFVVVRNFKTSFDGDFLWGRFNSDTGTNYSALGYTQQTAQGFGQTYLEFSQANDNSVDKGLSYFTVYDYANTTTWKMLQGFSINVNQSTTTNFNTLPLSSFWNQTSAITSITFFGKEANFTGGTVYVYGVK